ncbi:hypothetical protein QUB37_29195 [Microcoleus sp. AT3-A2]
MRNHQLWDFVRPCTEYPDSIWRVIEILPNNRLIAELRPGCLEPVRVHRIEADFDHFISLEEEEEE